jgi:hypothetical protein
MPHTIKAGKADLTISSARVVRHSDRMHHWTPERRSGAAESAKARLSGKHPRKSDAAIVISVGG